MNPVMSSPQARPQHADVLVGEAVIRQARWHWFDAYEDVPWADWEALPGGSAYLDHRYLAAMAGHGKVQCRIGMIKADGGPWLGGILMQAVQSESRSPAEHMDVSFGVRLATAIMQPGGRPFRFRTLVAGQGLGSGEHTFLWREGITPAQQVFWTEQAFNQCARQWGIRVWMAKDFGPQRDAELAPHWSRRWARATFDPVMEVPLDPTWTSADQWQEALRTKARTKVRSILARSADLQVQRITDPTELDKLGPDLIALYEQVYGRASIVMGGLEAPDFGHLVSQLGDDFALVTYRDGEHLIGFHCGLHHAETATIEAYYVGFEAEVNKERALYQRMLFEFIQWGISVQARRVVMGRTALEIKSTLGAFPVPLSTFVHIQLPLAMPFLRWMIRKAPPHPFKPRRAWRAEWCERWQSEGYQVN
ncbi:MAG: GNAT family N-acetyltransferase [Flavobacteriales bacterium]|nr:GNAT family N-acetyltransferase [Flavobacteriales bacterium]